MLSLKYNLKNKLNKKFKYNMSIKCSEVVNFNISLGYYRLISQTLEEEIKYINGFKSLINEYFKKALTLQLSSGTKLGKLPDEFANAKWIDSSPILKLIQIIPKIIQKQIENLQIFIKDIEKPLIDLDDYFKSKSSEIKRYQQKYDDVNNDLVKKYIDIEKTKISFLNSMNKSEEIIIKCLQNKKRIEDVKKGKIKMNDSELKTLNDKNKDYESRKKSSINSSKKLENEYKNVIKNTSKYEEKFVSVLNESVNGIKDVCGEITDKIKDTIISFLTTIRDSFKVPLDLIDNNISSLTNSNEKEIISKAMEGTFNYEQKFLHITPTRYSLNMLEVTKKEISIRINSKEDTNNKDNNVKKKNKKKDDNNVTSNNGYIKFEDGFEEMGYFEDDIALLAVKEMFNNFQLINHNGLDIYEEEEKNMAKRFINKLIVNMSDDPNKLVDDYNIISIDDCEPFTDEDIVYLIKLLSKHNNRVIFLHKLNDYRTYNMFELKDKEYKIVGGLFTFLIDAARKEKDFHSVEMAIILSKTYYKLENNVKIYIQNYVKNNGDFKTKGFWEELLVYSITKEVIRSNKRDEGNNNNNEKSIYLDLSSPKNENIVFSQLLSLIDNMVDFGVEGDMIKQIIEPKIESYKLSDNLKKTINEYIASKIKEKNTNEIKK